MAFAFDRTFVDRVENTLNIGKRGWSPFAASSLLAHIEEHTMRLWECDLQMAMEYEILVRFMLEALRERYCDDDFFELLDLVEESNTIIEGAAYDAQISQYQRAHLNKIAQTTDQLLVHFIGASLS